MSKSTANSNGRAKPRGKPWPKGVSGNPKGAPKRGMSWREIIDRVGDEMHGEMNQKQAVAWAMFKQAIRGNTSAAAWLARYGGGETEFSKYTDDQLRDLIASRLGIALNGTSAGIVEHSNGHDD